MNTRRYTFLVLGLILSGFQPAVRGQARLNPTSLTLEDALGYALEHNFLIRRTRAQLDEQDGIVTTVAAAGLPSVSASGSFQRSSIQPAAVQPIGPLSPIAVFPSGRYWRMNVTARQMLYAGGSITAANKAAQLTRDAAAFELKEAIAEALLDVRLKFYNVLLAREQIFVAEKSLELLRQQLSDVTKRTDAGSSSQFELLRAEVASANAKPPLIKARNGYRLAVEELRQAMGYTQSASTVTDLTVVGSLQAEPYSVDLGTALSTARENRPLLVHLAKLVTAADELRTVAQSGDLPQFSATLASELRKGASERFSDSVQGLRYGVGGQLAVEPRKTDGKVMQAESYAEQSRLALDGARLAIDVEVRRAVSGLEQASELLAATAKSVDQAVEALRVAEVQFAAGSSTQLEILEAQTALTTARTNQLRAVYEHNVAAARLRRGMGISEVAVGTTEASAASPQP